MKISLDELLFIAETKSPGNYEYFKSFWLAENTDLNCVAQTQSSTIYIIMKDEYNQVCTFRLGKRGLDIYIFMIDEEKLLVSNYKFKTEPFFMKRPNEYIDINVEESTENWVTEIYEESQSLDDFAENISSKFITIYEGIMSQEILQR